MTTKKEIRKMLVAWRDRWYYYSCHDKSSAGFDDFKDFNKIIDKLK